MRTYKRKPLTLNTEENEKTLVQDLAEVINRHSKENDSNTPDFILAEYLENCLNIFAAASRKREAWYGKELKIGMKTDQQ